MRDMLLFTMLLELIIDVSKRTLAILKEAQACMEINNDVDECALMCYATMAVDEGCTSLKFGTQYERL